MRKSLDEAISLSVGTIDAETHTLRDVAVLGESSLNNRRYSRTARQDGVRLAEGAKVFLNHRPRDAAGRRTPHDVRNFVGRLEGTYLGEDGVVRAKTLKVVNEAHWPLLHNLAHDDPKSVGMSIEAEGDVDTRTNEVLRIKEMRSVDIVSDPAATRGFFEETDMDGLKDLTLDTLRAERPDLLKALDDEITALKAKIAELEKPPEGEEEKKTGDGGEPTSAVKEEVDRLRKQVVGFQGAMLVESRLRAALASGVKMSDVQQRAYLALKEEKDAAAFLEELKKSPPRSRPKSGSSGSSTGELTSAALREAVCG